MLKFLGRDRKASEGRYSGLQGGGSKQGWKRHSGATRNLGWKRGLSGLLAATLLIGSMEQLAYAESGEEGRQTPSLSELLEQLGGQLGDGTNSSVQDDVYRGDQERLSIAGAVYGLPVKISAAAAGAPGTGDSRSASVSGDGRFVAFASASTNLIDGDTNGKQDIFLQDRVSGTTKRISVGGGGSQADGDSYAPYVSFDGTYVLFTSKAKNLVSNDTNFYEDLFLYDARSEVVQRVAQYVPGSEFAGAGSSYQISADGRYVVYAGKKESQGTCDIWLLDRRSGTVKLVARQLYIYETFRSRLSISADGRFVAFDSFSKEIVPDDVSGNYSGKYRDVYLYDATLNEMKKISRAPNGTTGNNNSYYPAISADGNYVAYLSKASNIVSADTKLSQDVYVYARQTGTTELVSVNGAGEQPGVDAYDPSISADGRYVSFHTDAAYDETDTGRTDVYVRDRIASTTLRVSKTAGGENADQPADRGTLSADGRTIVFETAATNMGESADTDAYRDIYAVALNTGEAPVWPEDAVVAAEPGGTYVALSWPAVPGAAYYKVLQDGRVAGIVTGTAFAVDGLGLGSAHRYQVAAGTAGYDWSAWSPEIETQTLAAKETNAPGASAAAVLPALGGAQVSWSYPADRDVVGAKVLWRKPGGAVYESPLYPKSVVSALVPNLENGEFYDFAVAIVDGDGNRGTGEWKRAKLPSGPAVVRMDVLRGSGGPAGSQNGDVAAINGDGRYTLFTSDMHFLVPEDDRTAPYNSYTSATQLYLYDSELGSVRLISRTWDGKLGNGNSSGASISADGRYIVFGSAASNLIEDTPDTNGKWDVFLVNRDVNGNGTFDEPGDTSLSKISTPYVNGGQANGDSSGPVISADGSTIIFNTNAKNLVDEPPTGTSYYNIIMSMEAREPEALILPNGKSPGVTGFSMDLSADGKTMAFNTYDAFVEEDTDGGSDIYWYDWHDPDAKKLVWLSGMILDKKYSGSVKLDGSGKIAVFNLTLQNYQYQTYVFNADAPAGTIPAPLIEVPIESSTSLDYLTASDVSEDGRYVLFESSGKNIVTGLTGNYTRVYLWDRIEKKVSLVSQPYDPALTSSSSASYSFLSGDGTRAAYLSTMMNMVRGSERAEYSYGLYLQRIALAAPAATWPAGSALTASDVGKSSVKLTWTAAANATGGYRVEGGPIPIEVPAGTLETIVTGLSPATDYSFSVQASSSGGVWTTNGPTTVIRTSADQGLADLTLTSTGSKVTLVWGDPATGTGAIAAFRVLRKTGAENWTLLTTISDAAARSYTDETALAGRTYTYVIRSVDGSQKEAAYSVEKSIVAGSFSISSFSYSLPLYLRQNAGHGDAAQLTLRGPAGGSTQAVLAYENVDGVSKTLETALTETEEAGLYKGEFIVPDDAKRLVSMKGTVTRDDSYAEAEALRAPVPVGGTVNVMLSGAAFVPEDALLNVYSQKARAYQSVTLGTRKTVELKGLPEADDYKLSLLGAGGRDLFEESGLPDIDVVAGDRQTVNVEPLLPAALSITILNPNWRGQGNRILVTDHAGNLLGAGTTMSNGRFNLPAFKKRIGQRIHIRVEPEDSRYEPIEQTVTLASGINTAEITLVRRTDAKIEGTVKDSEGKPVAGATVKAIFDQTYTAVTDGDGKYALGVPEGYMYIQAFAGGSFASEVKYLTAVQGTQTVDIIYKQRIPAQVEIKLYTKSGDGEWVGPYDLDAREMVHYRISSSVRNYGGGNPLSVEAEAGQTVKICANGAEAGYKSVCGTTVIGADRKGEVELRMIDKGTQIVGSLDGIQGNAALYGLENGTARKYIRGFFMGKGDFKIKVPDAGAYELVLMSNLDKKVLIRAFQLAEGEALNLGKLTFGELGRFAGQSGNQVLLGTSRPAPGATLQVRVQYTNTSRDALTDGAIVLDIPSGAAFVPGSAVWKGQTVTPGQKDGRYIVPIGAIGADVSGTLQYQLRMAETPDGNRLAVAPHMVYQVQGQSKEEEIGVALADIAAVTMIAPDRTGYRKFAVTGTAPAGSTVSVFAGDRVVATAQTSPAGRWSASVDMEGEGKTAVWQMYALARTDSGSWNSSQTTVRYDVNVAEPIEFTMSQPDGRTITIDPREGEAKFPYVLVPGWPIYLTVKFNHPDLVSGVSFTFGETRLQASLKNGVYQAITDGGAVGPIGIDYTTKEPADSFKGPPPSTDELKAQMPPAFRDARQENLYISPREGGDRKQSMSFTGTLPSTKGDASMTLDASLERKNYTPTTSDLTQVEETGVPVYGLQVAESFDRGTLKYELNGYLPADEFASGLDIGKALAYMSAGADIDLYKEMATSVKAKSAPVKTLNATLAAVKVTVKLAFESKAGENTWKAIDSAYSLYDGRGTGDSFDDLAYIMDKIARYCPPNLIPVEMEYVELLRNKIVRNELIKHSITLAGFFAGPTTFGVGSVALFIASNAFGKMLDASLAAQMKRFNDDINDLCNVPKKPKKPIADPEWIYDPSGYVYEVTEDNRIEGVKATALRWNEETKRWDVWDADWYGQENPLYTDTDGRYAWDVPEGKWKVLYEKEGYLPAESEELTVLPPHFDVNIPMISTLPAKPVQVEAAPGGTAVDIVFDRHVNSDTVSGSLFAVIHPATHEDIPGTWAPVEPLADGNSKRIRFTPDAPLTIDGTYLVYVDGAVQSYAGIPLGERYETEVLVTEHDTTPPAAVTELAAEADQDEALITWRSARDSDATRFAVVYKVRGAAGDGMSTDIPADRRFTLLQGLQANTAYEIEVRAYDAAGNYSVAKTSTDTAGAQPAAADIVPPGPAIVGSITADAAQATIAWTDPSDHDLFAVKLQREKNGEAFVADPTTVLKGVGKYTITGLSPSTAYEIRIWTVDLSGNESSAQTLFVTTKASGSNGNPGNPGNPGGNGGLPDPDGESKDIGEGGELSFFGGKMKLWLPGAGGAAGAAKKVTAAKVAGSPAPSDAHLKLMSDVYAWKLDTGARLANPGKLTIAYDAPKLSGADPRKLGLYRQDAADKTKWTYAGGIVDVKAGEVMAEVTEPGVYAVFIAEYTFSDLANHWSRADVEALAARGIVTGDPSGTFRPNGSVTRAEFVKLVLPLLSGVSGPGLAAERFADVPADAWYAEAVAAATAAGIVKGADGKFRPTDPITREEMAVMLHRALGIVTDDLDPVKLLEAYSDRAKVAGWARLQVAYAVKSGLLKGSGGKLNPGATATRAEAATVVLRALEAAGRITKKS